MIAALGASIIFSILFIFLFRCCPRFIIWICCIIVFLSLIAVATYAYLYSKGIVYFTIPIDLSSISTLSLQISAYVLWGLAGVFLIFILCAYKRIKLCNLFIYSAIGVIETTSLYISETCQVTLFPPIMSLIWLGFLITILAGLLYLYSIGTMYDIFNLDQLHPDQCLLVSVNQIKELI